MSNLISFFTKKPVKEIQQDTVLNDQRTKDGKYIGHLHPSSANIVRDMGALVSSKADEIDRLVEQWQELMTEYLFMQDTVLETLNAEGFNLDTHAMSISEEGHVWIVPLPTEE